MTAPGQCAGGHLMCLWTADRHVARLAGLLGLPWDASMTRPTQACARPPTSFGNSFRNLATPQLVALTLKEAMVTR